MNKDPEIKIKTNPLNIHSKHGKIRMKLIYIKLITRRASDFSYSTY